MSVELADPSLALNHGVDAHVETPHADTRDAEFDAMMKENQQKATQNLANEKSSVDEYFEDERKRENELREKLKHFLEPEHLKHLSEGQQDELHAQEKYLAYREKSHEIYQHYSQDPQNPEYKAAYEAHQQKVEDTWKLVEDSAEFKDNAHMKAMKGLHEELHKAGTEDKKLEIVEKINGEAREFARDVAHDPEGKQKLHAFVESHKNDAFLKESGAADRFAAQDKSSHEHTLSPAEELKNTAVNPAGPPVPGSVTYKDDKGVVHVTSDGDKMIARDAEGHLETAGKVVTATIDDGKGGVKTEQYAVSAGGEMGRVNAAPTPDASGQGNNVAAHR